MTEEEKRFVTFWANQRLHKKQYLRRFSVGLPVAALIAAAVLANFLSGWYKKADAAVHADSSVIFVVVIAVVAIMVFIMVFTAHHKWDRNEAAYQELMAKQEDANQENKTERVDEVNSD